MQETEEMTVPVEINGDTVSASADPAQADTAEETAETNGETAPPVSADTAALSDENYLPVYNGEVHPIRASDRQEITTLLQLGMKQRDFLPHYERLSRLAADSGDKSVKALIDRLCETAEKERLDKAVNTYGEEDGKRFYELERAQRTRHYDEQMRQQRETADRTLAHRLADEFVLLQKAHPELGDIRKLPREVIEAAVTEGVSLIDAHNRFMLAEQKRRDEHAAAEQHASATTTGSLSQYGDTPLSAMDAFVSGLHSRSY